MSSKQHGASQATKFPAEALFGFVKLVFKSCQHRLHLGLCTLALLLEGDWEAHWACKVRLFAFSPQCSCSYTG